MYSLFGIEELARLLDLGDHHLRQAGLRLPRAALLRHHALLVVVREDQRRVLALDARRQPVLVVVPEQLQQLLVGDHRRIEVDADHLGVVAATCARTTDIIAIARTQTN